MSKPITRRASLILGASALFAPALLRAQEGLPDKPIRILVGFPAGGGSDVMARFIAEGIRQRTGRNIVIENKPGASGTVAGVTLKTSPPDGTTICFMPSATVWQKLSQTTSPFDIETDADPIALIGTVPSVYCVAPSIGVNTVADYVEWLNNNPTKASFGSTAMGSFSQFFGAMLGQAINKPLDAVAYRGAAPPTCKAAISQRVAAHSPTSSISIAKGSSKYWSPGLSRRAPQPRKFPLARASAIRRCWRAVSSASSHHQRPRHRLSTNGRARFLPQSTRAK